MDFYGIITGIATDERSGVGITTYDTEPNVTTPLRLVPGIERSCTPCNP